MSIKHTKSWEDPWVELLVLDEIIRTKEDNNNLEICMSCGAGDTILSLLSSDICRIVCVDKNSGNLAQLELKAFLCKIISDPDIRFKFLDGQINASEQIKIYNKFRNDLEISKSYWDKNINLILRGIYNLDTISRLFNLLTYQSLSSSSELFNPNNENLEYSNVFSCDNIIKYFGVHYLENTYSNPFWKHIKESLNKLYDRYKDRPHHNIFYSQILHEFYCPLNFRSKHIYANYLNKSSRDFDTNKLRYIHKSFPKYLLETDKRFDMISTSYLTDFMDESQIDAFAQLVKSRLHNTRNARAIFRRMNGNIVLYDILNRYFIILNIDRDFRDRTYLYKEVIVGLPR